MNEPSNCTDCNHPDHAHREAGKEAVMKATYDSAMHGAVVNEVSRTWEVRYVDSYGMIMHTTVFHDIEAARDEIRLSSGKTTTAAGWTVRLGRDDVSEEAGLNAG